MHLSQNIKHLRKSRKLNQTELGEAVGKSFTVIGTYEAGKSQPPLDTIIALANYFEVNLDDFVFRDLSKEDPKPFEKKETTVNEQLLIEMLHKRVRTLEAEFKEMDPERAKRLGIE